MLQAFKTINPQYVLRTPQLMQEIVIATLNPQVINPFVCAKDTSGQILEDFVFACNDTIATILSISYG